MQLIAGACAVMFCYTKAGGEVIFASHGLPLRLRNLAAIVRILLTPGQEGRGDKGVQAGTGT